MGEERAGWSALRRVLVLTEGQTEEAFIKRVLQRHLWQHGVSLEPKIVTTKHVIGGANIKGGGDAQKMLADARRLLGDTNAVAVTTLFDFYGFPSNLPNAAPNIYRDIDLLTQSIDNAVANVRFKAYLQRHEFEAFLFVDPQVIADVARKPDQAASLLKQRNQFETVEDINLDPALALTACAWNAPASPIGWIGSLLWGRPQSSEETLDLSRNVCRPRHRRDMP